MRMGLCCRRGLPAKLKLAAVLCLTAALGAAFFRGLQPAFDEAASSYAQERANNAINDSVLEVLKREDVDYSDLAELVMSEDGIINAVESDTVRMNLLKSEVTKEIQKNANSRSWGTVRIPIAAVFGSDFLTGLLPKLPIRVSPLSVVRVNFGDSFESKGINQVKHEIYLEAVVTISIIGASMNKTDTVTSIIPVADTVIVGGTPQYYSSGGGNLSIAAE